MRLAVLTTQTLHHARFLQALADEVEVGLVLNETESVQPAFEVHHPFEHERELFESRTWFDGGTPLLSDWAPVQAFPSLNSPDAVQVLQEFRPDVCIVFGTGKLSTDVINCCPGGAVNLHGGDPEEYRGLDTHLWAIYHNDRPGLVTTLHTLAPELDSGEIVSQTVLDIRKCEALHQFRLVNTEACVGLCLDALRQFQQDGRFSSRKQDRTGRYYSFMPAVLKELCVKKFDRIRRDHA